MAVLTTPTLLVEKEITSTNSDMLASTDLETMPFNGILMLAIGSTVNTATVEIAQPGHRAGITNNIRKKTDGIPLLDVDPVYSLRVTRGQKIGVSVGGTTGTVHLTAMLYGAP